MAKKLKFLLVNQTRWRLLFKAIIASFALLGVYWLDFSFWPIFTAIIVLGIVFFRESPERKVFAVSFWLIALLGLFGFYFLGGAISISPLAVLGFTFLLFALFFLWFGLVGFFFPNRFAIYGIFNTGVLVGFFLVFFYLNLPSAFASLKFNLFWSLGLFLGVALIFKEVFGFFGVFLGKRGWLTSFSLGFLAFEMAWFLAFLPLGFVNAATFLALVFILLRDSILAHFQGHLDIHFLFREFTFFVFLSIIIFATAKWAI